MLPPFNVGVIREASIRPISLPVPALRKPEPVMLAGPCGPEGRTEKVQDVSGSAATRPEIGVARVTAGPSGSHVPERVRSIWIVRVNPPMVLSTVLVARPCQVPTRLVLI